MNWLYIIIIVELYAIYCYEMLLCVVFTLCDAINKLHACPLFFEWTCKIREV